MLKTPTIKHDYQQGGKLPDWREHPDIARLHKRRADLTSQLAKLNDEYTTLAARYAEAETATRYADVLKTAGRATDAAVAKAQADETQAKERLGHCLADRQAAQDELAKITPALAVLENEAREDAVADLTAAYVQAVRRMLEVFAFAQDTNAEVKRIFVAAMAQFPHYEQRLDDNGQPTPRFWQQAAGLQAFFWEDFSLPRPPTPQLPVLDTTRYSGWRKEAEEWTARMEEMVKRWKAASR